MLEGWRHSGQGGDWLEGGAKPDLKSQRGGSGRKSVPADSVGSSRCWGRVSLLLLFPSGLCIDGCFLQGDGGVSACWQDGVLLFVLS